MEVFCRNVPQDLSEEGFIQELMPFMKALNITDFYCEKPKRRPQAWIKFLNPGDGYSFLERHGKQQRYDLPQKENINPRYPFKTNFRPKDTPRLHILKTAVFVEKSIRALDKHSIAHLKYERDKKQQKAALEGNEKTASRDSLAQGSVKSVGSSGSISVEAIAVGEKVG